MADLDVLQELQVYLIGQGVAQHPDDAPSLVVPSVWLMPRKGAPLPRENKSGVVLENMTITLRDTDLRSPSTLEPWMQESFIDVIVRSRQPTPGKFLQRAILTLIAPGDLPGGRHQWMMGALLVETSTQWRGDQELAQLRSIAQADPHVTYDRVAAYRFLVRRKVLAGLTIP